MTRDEVTQAVASALALDSSHPNVKTVLGLSWAFPNKHWNAWPWWNQAREAVEAEEGGTWGVVWVIASRALAHLPRGPLTNLDVEQATLVAVQEVGREFRRNHVIDYTTAPIDVLIDMGIAAPPEFTSEHPNTRAMVELLYAVATPSEREVLDLLAEGLNQVEAAGQLGVNTDSVYRRMTRLRKRVRAKEVTQ